MRRWRSRARLRHSLIGERTQWMECIQATLFHFGVSGTPKNLRTRAGRAFLGGLPTTSTCWHSTPVSTSPIASG